MMDARGAADWWLSGAWVWAVLPMLAAAAFAFVIGFFTGRGPK